MSATELPQTSTLAKKPYTKPAIVYQQPLEAMAASCTPGAKLSTFPGPCATASS